MIFWAVSCELSYRHKTPGGAVNYMMTTLYPGLERPQFWELTTKTWEQVHTGTKDQLYLKQPVDALDGCFGWHHRLNGHEFEQVPEVGDGQGSLVCCSPLGSKELDTTERLKWIESNQDDTSQTTHDQFEDDCTISACNPPPTLSIKLSPPACHGGERWPLNRWLPLLLPVAGIWNKANVLFHQPALYTGF